MSFDASAKNYLNSVDHRSGDDTDYVQAFFKGFSFRRQLDVATGAGHFSQTLKSDQTTVADLSFNMLKTASNSFDIDHAVCSVSENLPFASNSFDLVTCRIAMHHFNDPELFFKEASRVGCSGGYFVLIDSVVDLDDAELNTIEWMRDDTHYRSYTLSEILHFSQNIFRLENYNVQYKVHPFQAWASRLGNSPENIKEINDAFMEFPSRIKSDLKVETEGEKVLSYTDKKGIFIFKNLK